MKKNTYLYYCHEIIHLTPDIAKLTLIAVDKPLSYQVGQYVEIELSKEIKLPLSIANAPTPTGTLEFQLRHNSTHVLAEQFLSMLAKNKSVRLSGPFGKSTLSQAIDYENLLFIAGGTGFAPIKALLKKALTQKQFKKIILFWGICRPIDAYEEKLLLEWQALYPHFDFTLVLSEPEQHLSWQGAKGLVHQFCADHIQDLDNVCVYMSGPTAMVKSAQVVFENQKIARYKLVSDLMEHS